MAGNTLNKSYLWAVDEQQGWNYTTYFSFFNDFLREDGMMKYVEIFFIMILCAASFTLNCLLIVFFLWSKELRTRQHMFVVSVLASSIFLLPFAVIIGLNRLSEDGWMFGDFVCRTTMYAFLSTAFIKIWLMSIISIDRYLKVVHLPNRHLGRRSSVLLTLAAWTFPIITLALMVYPNTTSVQTQIPGNVTVSICSAMFKYHETLSFALIHFSTVFILEFLLPASLMTVSYVKIMRKIKHSARALNKHSGKTFPRPKSDTAAKNNSKERRSTKILILILVLFLLMWSPLFALLAMLSLDQKLHTYQLSSRYIVGQLCLLIANTIVEPVLFALTTGQVRQKLSTVCKMYRRKRTVSAAPTEMAVTRFTYA